MSDGQNFFNCGVRLQIVRVQMFILDYRMQVFPLEIYRIQSQLEATGWRNKEGLLYILMVGGDSIVLMTVTLHLRLYGLLIVLLE